MIYVEIINLIKKIKNGSRDNLLIDSLNNIKYKYSGNANIRLQNSLVKAIDFRINNAIGIFFSSINNDTTQIQLIISELQSETQYCKLLSKSSLLDKETSDTVYGMINTYLSKADELFKSLFSNSADESLSMLALNINLGGKNEL